MSAKFRASAPWEDFPASRHGEPHKPRGTFQPGCQVPGTHQPPPTNPLGARVGIWGDSENCLKPGLPAGRSCQLGRTSEKVLKIRESSERPKPEGSRESLTGTTRTLGVRGGGSGPLLELIQGGSAPNPRLPARGPQIPARSELGGGDKGGAGAVPAGRAWRHWRLTSWLLRRRAAHPQNWAPLARGSGVQGWLRVLLSLPQGPAP